MMIAPREKAFSKVVGVMGDMKGAECPAPRIALGTSGGRESAWITGEPPPLTGRFSGRLISGPRQRWLIALSQEPVAKSAIERCWLDGRGAERVEAFGNAGPAVG